MIMTFRRRQQRHNQHCQFLLLSYSLNSISIALLLLLNILQRASSSSSSSSLEVVACNDDAHKCLNGGICISGMLEGTGEEIKVCDCKDAIDEEGNRYVGLHCEEEAPKEDEFCINGGKPKTVQSGIIMCSCPEEYTGLYCELSRNSLQIQALLDEKDDDEEDCTLLCLNGGYCAFARRAASPAELALYPNYNPNWFYEHCQCPKGFYGTQCESSYDVCDDDDNNNNDEEEKYYCHNNSTCFYISDLNIFDENDPTEDGLPEYVCNCTAAQRSGKDFSGKHCEYQNSVLCNNDDDDNRRFCTNGGSCKKDKNDLWSCTCPKGYKGDYCEYAPGTFAETNKKSQQSSPPTRLQSIFEKFLFWIFLSAILSLMLAVHLPIAIRLRRPRNINIMSIVLC